MEFPNIGNFTNLSYDQFHDLIGGVMVSVFTLSFRGEDFDKSANQKKKLPVAVMFVNGLGRNKQTL